MQINVIRLSHFLRLKLSPFIKVPPGVKMPGKKGGLIKDIELCRFYGTLFNRSYFPMKHSSVLLKAQIIKKRACKAVLVPFLGSRGLLLCPWRVSQQFVENMIIF